jgi:hypothetical protein
LLHVSVTVIIIRQAFQYMDMTCSVPQYGIPYCLHLLYRISSYYLKFYTHWVKGINSTPILFFKIHFNIPPSMFRSSNWCLPSVLLTNNFYVISLSPMCSSCSTHLWSTQYLMRTTTYDAHYAIFSVLLGPYLFLSTLFSKTLSERQFHTGRI